MLLALGDILQIHMRPLLAMLHSCVPRDTLVLEELTAQIASDIASQESSLPAHCDVLATLQKLPAMCLTRSKISGAVIAIRRGELGYHLVDTNLTPEEFNARYSISAEQVQAMENGALHGWEVPAADPDIIKALRSTHTNTETRAPSGSNPDRGKGTC